MPVCEFGPWDAESKVALIVGGGPSGLLCARSLMAKGWKVHVFERRENPALATPGRAWPLVLGERGQMALEAQGINIAESGVVVKGGAFMGKKGITRRLVYAGSKDKIALDRNKLMQALLTPAWPQGAKSPVHFRAKYAGLRDKSEDWVRFEGDNLGEEGGPWALLIAADGEQSAVRTDLADNYGFTCKRVGVARDYCQVSIPFNVAPDLPKDIVCGWARRGGIQMVIVPSTDDAFSGVFVLPKEGEDKDNISFPTVKRMTREQFSSFLDTMLPGSRPYLDAAYGGNFHAHICKTEFFDSGSSTICNDLGSERGHVILIGDAAHSMSAALGQGCNSALEDVSVLSELLDCGVAVQDLHKEYTRARLHDVVAIVELSMNAFPTTVIGFAMFALRSSLIQLCFNAIPRFPIPMRSYIQMAPFHKVKQRKAWERVFCDALLISSAAVPLSLVSAKYSGLVSSSLLACSFAAVLRLVATPTG